MNGRASLSGKPYSAGVRIANWNEDTYLEEDLLKDFLYKREKGELLIQKSKRLKNNLLKQMQLSVSKDGFIHFGDTVMLLSPENNKSPSENYSAACGNLTLAVNPDDITVHTSESLQVPCGVSAVKSVNPVGRNTFHILSVEGNSMGEPIRFGQNFGLGATGGFTDQMLYLASDHKSFVRFAKKSYLQQVFLTDELSYLTCWQAIFLDPQLRLEYEGFPVPANTKVLITHCHTNRGLAVPRNYWLRSYFGKEYEVICHTYLDSHKAEEDKNYWLIVTANPSDDGFTMFDRPKPPSEEQRERERNELYAGT
ncbi:LOW QUALITY PROTEIN: cilia- and flagella-associated protein 161 [Dermochelys coriacea]|uniref:LOW QUALITY PROTEIN: cilia- and flagella-associated protein 161 n=1 Tax=Dermochelys coriacea TaxID=27794 RepID=UPI0018E75492|nr:LOW QUALITY PROTEIN: cilia- and flagella-associated protein 161 [Dermochelys coriacea]